MKKSFLLILLSMLLPLVASAYDAYIDGIYYNFGDNEAKVTYENTNYNSYSGVVVIPESVTYNGKTYNVTVIGQNAFFNCSSLTSVTIPNNVTSIGNYAFRSCSGLTNVDFKGNNVHFGNGVFWACTSLKTLDLPAGDEILAQQLLSGCTNLETLTIPEGYKSFGRNCFGSGSSDGREYTKNLRTLSLPTTMESVVNFPYDIYGCLTTLYITPELMRTWIGGSSGYAYWRNFWQRLYNLKDVYVRASSILDICENGVLEPSGGGATESHAHLLIDGEEITELQIPEGVEDLASSAFAYMGFEKICLPSSLTSLSSEVFLQCWNLKEVVIPGSVKTIKIGAFSRCKNLEKVILEEGVEVMESYTFDWAIQLKEVYLPSSIRQIGSKDFDNCSGLTDVFCYAEQIPTTYSDAFSNSSIASATLHVPVGSINLYNAVSPWNNFGSITPLDGIGDYANIDGIYYIFSENNAEVSSIDKAYSGAVAIPESVTYNGKTYTVTSIGDYAFASCSGITSITISESVTSIGKGAFADCSNMTSITIPSGVTSINMETFVKCSSLTSVIIPNGVTSIGDFAFQNCTSLTSVTLPNSLTSIERYAFSICI